MDGKIRGGFTIRHRMAFEGQPALGPIGPGKLGDQARLADAGLSDDGHHLAMTCPGALQGLMELIQLSLTPHEARQTARCGRLQARPHGPAPVTS